MKIETLDALIEFVKECKSAAAIEKVIKATLNVNYIMWSNTPIDEVKDVTIKFIEDFRNEKEMPLFIITNLNSHWKFLSN